MWKKGWHVLLKRTSQIVENPLSHKEKSDNLSHVKIDNLYSAKDTIKRAER